MMVGLGVSERGAVLEGGVDAPIVLSQQTVQHVDLIRTHHHVDVRAGVSDRRTTASTASPLIWRRSTPDLFAIV
jgi:hypothetical protein